jgi:phosphate-selective porin
MKKFFLGVAALLLGSSFAYAYDTEIPNQPVVEQTEQVAIQPESTSGLTPKRPATVKRAQPPAPAVTPFIPYYANEANEPVQVAAATPRIEKVAFSEPAPSGYDTRVYAELDRLSHEIQQLRKGSAAPDTKRAWSAPKFNGRVFVDSVNFMDEKNTGAAATQNAAGFRELRLGATGSGFGAYDYKIEFGFHQDGGRVALIDNWIGAKNVPLLGYLRVGHYKPETGLYYPMGSTNITAMEYTTPANIFGLGRRIGISSEHLFAHDRVRLFVGVFQGAGTDNAKRLIEDNQGQIVNLRLTMAPWYAQEGKYLFHVGGHWAYESLDSGAIPVGATQKHRTLNAAPGTFSWASNTLTATFDNDYSNRGGLEFAYQYGRFSARSELFAGSFNVNGGGQGKHLYGSYVELGYFLTDDFRTYSLSSGGFGGVKMKSNFEPFQCGQWNLVRGTGAWQAFFQWGYTDMEDWRDGVGTASIGGHQNDFVVGMNWYWTPNIRWMFQYVRSEQCVGANYLHKSQDIFGTSLRLYF